MLSSAGYWVFSHPEICSGDQSRISLLATSFRNFTWTARRQRLGRRADSQAWWSASWARYSGRPPWRATSRLTVDAARSRPLAISRIDEPEASPREMSSRSTAVSTGSERRYAACQRRARWYATTLPLSSGATRQSVAPQKAPRISLASYTPPRNEDL